ncbi:hypothetical protein SAMN05444483_103335 [Salegentibacter echinorum]|uniref:Lipoprotein n=1 Tax=Salegentibacter echinorum TaxID=1073325 RepID=A0A1M5FT59_SALEC|nr:membrane lipoprotein lipid attachment site-containing protein [Salegentibacter echinorum]SHF94599.1 hypothetical protein SAMN05444483_103335 [Salegentibacter echinorum]
MKKLIILISFLGILSGCSSNDDADVDTREFVPKEIAVGIKSGTAIKETFHFINQFDHKVDKLNSLTFTSNLPSDSLQYVLDFLNKKPYTNDGINWFVTGYLHYQTNQITIFPKLFGIDKLEYQNDWLITMEGLKLNEKHNTELNSGIVRFYVPEGKEKEWKSRFENHEIVDWAELSYIADIVPHNE